MDIVQAYKADLDPALFYERVEPERAKELASKINTLRLDNNQKCILKTGHARDDMDFAQERRKFEYAFK